MSATTTTDASLPVDEEQDGRVDGGWPLTDLGNAEQLVKEHGRDLHFVHPWTKWLVWDGRRWCGDDTGEVVRRATTTIRALAEDALELKDDARRRLLKHALNSEREARIRAMVTLAQSRPGVPLVPASLDADPWILNVENGTLDVDTGNLRAHRREDLLTKLAPVRYEPGARCDRWHAFLDRVLDGNKALIAYVQRALGYSLTGDTSEHVLFLLYGTGANGKTVFLETVRALLGDYGLQTPAETLLVSRYSGVPNDVARLRGARFVAAVETPEGRRLDETLIKQLTGGDTVPARFMRSEWFEFTPTFKLWLATNHKPEIRNNDEAIWRRIMLIPFTVTIPAGERDNGLKETLRRELSGILNWALEGCGEWAFGDGLRPPEAVRAATDAYRDEMDVLGDFLRDRCVIAPDARAKASELYTVYGYWCASAGIPDRDRLTQKALGIELARRHFESRRTSGARWWHGLGILTPESDA